MGYFIKGKGPITFNKNTDAVGSGGQAQVYAKNGLALKIYTNPKNMLPVSKIQELSVLTDSNIIKPQDVILDESSNKPVGYTMRFLKDSVALCQLFPKAFKKRKAITPDMTLALVKKLQNIVKHCHEKKILIVDLNEMNFMLNDKFNEVYAIDVDSYQTPSFPATFLMKSVRDRHCHGNKWNEGTDWFSFGVVSFNMLVGIHPYKGTHPDYAKDDLDGRMQNNISVMHSGVTMPPVVLPFDVIPSNWRDWYKAIFEEGKRLDPPFDGQVMVVVLPKVTKVTGSNNFNINLVDDYGEDIIQYLVLNNMKLALTSKGLYLGNRLDAKVPPKSSIGMTPKMSHVIAANINSGKLSLYNASLGKQLVTDISADKLMTYDGRLYAKNSDRFYELEFTELAVNTMVSLKCVATVLENGTQVFDGVLVQNLLGSYHFSVFPKPHIHQQVKISELNSYRIMDAKFDNNVLMVVGEHKGKYDKFVIRFDADYQSYDLRVVKDIVPAGLNFVTLDNGICAHINEDGDMELFFNQKGSASSKIITVDSSIGSVRLAKNGVKTMFTKDDCSYTIEVKKKP